jgi:hypothetical protein
LTHRTPYQVHLGWLHLELLAQQELQVKMDHQDHLALMEVQDLQDHLALMELQEVQDHLALMEHQEQMELQHK